MLLIDVDVSSPDEKSVITYVSSLYDAFPKVPEGGEGIGANVSIDFSILEASDSVITSWLNSLIKLFTVFMKYSLKNLSYDAI